LKVKYEQPGSIWPPTLRLYREFWQLAGCVIFVEVAALSLVAPVGLLDHVFVEEHLHGAVIGQCQLRVHAQGQGLLFAGQMIQVVFAEPAPDS
jgi:hypothetical protein